MTVCIFDGVGKYSTIFNNVHSSLYVGLGLVYKRYDGYGGNCFQVFRENRNH